MYYGVQIQIQSDVTVYVEGNSKDEVVNYVQSCDDFFVSSKYELVETDHICQFGDVTVNRP